ncbi:MAG: hypothetical protein ABUS54_14565 [Actinomycetota bacterium]
MPAAIAAATGPIAAGNDGDGRLFASAGRTLLSADALHAFASKSIQAGPLQLLLYGTIGRSTTAIAAVLGAVAILLLVAAARAVGVTDRRVLAGAGLAGLATGLSRSVYEAGHPADGLLPLLWILAAAEARRGRTVRAGLIVGLSTGFETWGILGLAVLALTPRAAALAVGVAAALFAPFVLDGHFDSGRYVWTISPNSLVLGHVAPGLSFGWPLRLVQAAAALAIGSSCAVALRRSAYGIWVVPIVVVCVRLLLDPLDTDYYFLGIASCGIAGGASIVQLLRTGRRIVPAWPVSATSPASP